MIQRRRWNWVDWSIFFVYTSSFLLNMLYLWTQLQGFSNTSLLLLSAAFVVAYTCPLLFWRPHYINPFLFPIAVLLTYGPLELFLAHSQQEFLHVLYCPLLVIGFLSDRKYAWWTAPVFILGFPIAAQLLIQERDTINTFSLTIWYEILFFGIGLSLQRFMKTNEKTEKLLQENQYQYQLIQGQNKVLEQYANQIEQQTLVEERNRMARELHDTVGHTFTSVIMGMDAVSYLIETSPQKAVEKLEVLRDVTRKGLEEVRRSIHQMASEEEDLLLSQQLSRLANEFALHTGTVVQVETIGTEYDLPNPTKLTFIRCLQESLTNAKRHGSASSVKVSISFKPHQVELHVQDDGIGNAELQAGFGISAMQERISALQGLLQVNSAIGEGTSVVCSIPTRKQPGS
ncbi:sensor histidine kinase [Paenibacillus eucommiae]|uniref:histidine kinase n=1 Tax=Paenibacillus eucommiae TaxID=1355755 RepID=A0ABS4J5A1_9BACL|nr:sensor histidine kinase [Paenibacillus eucommiae]MBP1995014.1 signal transduction histidine kinase [Paenibacillus eucommiae]